MNNEGDIKVLENILKDFPLILSRTVNCTKSSDRVALYNTLDWVRDRVEIVKLSLEEKAKNPGPDPRV